MAKSRFTDRQINEAIKRAEASFANPELSISSATFYKWSSKCEATDISQLTLMKELKADNERLCRMYVGENLKAEIVTEELAKTGEEICEERSWKRRMQSIRRCLTG
ncbi:transposase [Achromobacter sp. ESBL13]|uniref:transposase n=1 Tax=Achromobacter sp. ESBL13 TaxID=3077328 RepID=UPI003FA56661